MAPVVPLDPDAPAIGQGGTQNQTIWVEPLAPLAPVAPAGGHRGEHHGRRTGVAVTPVAPVAPTPGHGIGTGQPLVETLEPRVAGRTQRTHSTADPLTAAGHGGQPVAPVDPVAPEDAVAPVDPVAPEDPAAPLAPPQVITHFSPLWRWWRSL